MIGSGLGLLALAKIMHGTQLHLPRITVLLCGNGNQGGRIWALVFAVLKVWLGKRRWENEFSDWQRCIGPT
jgi:hypothetical protein